MANTEYAKGLEGVIAAESRICKIDGEHGRLYYLGYSINELAESCTFEEVTYLLLYGELPSQSELDAFSKRMRAGRVLADPVKEMVKAFPRNSHPMELLQSAISYLSGYVKHKIEHDAFCNCRDTLHQIAQLPTVIAAYYRTQNGKPIVE
ncbi:MAG TPA: citrate/2-methylcitrate synthase, partial [Spirochaetia bacterium]|nr:citrate/2-methylcitrate synthase [Spirochaetia bacterium]